MSSKKVVEDFLAQKKIAVVGVSRTKTKFGNMIYKELQQKDYDVYAVNPYITTFEDDACYQDLLSLPEKVDAAVICIPPTQAEAVVKQAKEAGINRIWLQQGSQSEAAEKFCKENEINCVSNECVLMFAQPTAFIHRAHRWIWKVLGKLPA